MRNNINYIVHSFLKLILFALLVMQISCVSTQCLVCDNEQQKVRNVHLLEESGLEETTFVTLFDPLFSKDKDGVKIHIINCGGFNPELLQSDSLTDFFENNLVSVDTSFVDYFSSSSDVDFPATKEHIEYSPKQLMCVRERSNLKIETRLMIGMRNPELNSFYLPGYEGGNIYEKQWFSISEGGSVLTTGIELGAVQKLFTVSDKHSFSFGLMSGFWPVDGGFHIPLAIHPRFTFNDQSSPFSGKCNAVYIFGDLGTTFDLKGEIPLEFPLRSTFWDIGVGVDFFQSKNHDFSIDAGYRHTSLSLPKNEDLIQCLIEAGLPVIDSYPVRIAGQMFVRVGYTF